MRVVVAPDDFKGTLSAREAAEAIRAGWSRARPGDELVLVPVSDGGPGFVEALSSAVSGKALEAATHDPLGRPRRASFLLAGDTCYLESAECCGLHLVPPRERDPLGSSSGGLADLLRAAAGAGARRTVVGLGGSATNDGGAGMLAALGFRLLDGAGRPLPPAPRHLARLDRVVAPERLPHPGSLVAAVDVDSPLLGRHGASRTFGPQKGASPAAVEELERALTRLAAVVGRDVPGAVGAEERPGAGAAGGIGYGLFVLGAARVRGIDLVVEATRLRERANGAGLVLTGEGSFDRQSLRGKAVAGVAGVARGLGVPCVVLAGRVRAPRREAGAAGVRAARSLEEVAGSAAKARAKPRECLERLAEQVASELGAAGTR